MRILMVMVAILGGVAWAQVPIPVPVPSSSSSSTTTADGNTSFGQMVTTQTAQGLQIFQGVSYQSFSGQKQQFMSSSDSADQDRQIKVSGS